ncbi:MAG: trypsin-like serine protease [Corynebacterium sp.]|nr:trypsin-like serine protease [Corynebacterium sp.]
MLPNVTPHKPTTLSQTNMRKFLSSVLATFTLLPLAMAPNAAAVDNENVETTTQQSGPLDNLEYGKDIEYFPEATSTVPVHDTRVAAMWNIGPDGAKPVRDCTASHLQGPFWITAEHCVPDGGTTMRVLKNHKNEVAGVQTVYTKSYDFDIALIKVGSGITADSFSLPGAAPQVGDYLNLLGYGASNEFSSLAEVNITQFHDSIDINGRNTHGVMETRAAGASRSCGGDSGAAIFKENTLFAVHTAGHYNPACHDKEDSPMIHSNSHPHIDWINNTIQEYGRSTPQEVDWSDESKKAFMRAMQ